MKREIYEQGYKLPVRKTLEPVEAPRTEAAFVQAGDKRSTPKRSATKGERIVVYLPPDLAEELKLRCVRERRSVSDAVTAAVRAMLVP